MRHCACLCTCVGHSGALMHVGSSRQNWGLRASLNVRQPEDYVPAECMRACECQVNLWLYSREVAASVSISRYDSAPATAVFLFRHVI